MEPIISSGTPLRYSCLENPMAGGAWWAAVHGRKELDTTEQLCFHFSLLCTGEGNGNPLQCSCLENPRDGGAWWAAVYGVTQSRTRLKRLSSSSSSNIPTAVGHGRFQEIKELWQGRQAVSLLRVDTNFAGFEAYMYTFHCLYYYSFYSKS